MNQSPSPADGTLISSVIWKGGVYSFIFYSSTRYKLLSLILLDGLQLPGRLDGVRRAFLDAVAGATVSQQAHHGFGDFLLGHRAVLLKQAAPGVLQFVFADVLRVPLFLETEGVIVCRIDE